MASRKVKSAKVPKGRSQQVKSVAKKSQVGRAEGHTALAGEIAALQERTEEIHSMLRQVHAGRFSMLTAPSATVAPAAVAAVPNAVSLSFDKQAGPEAVRIRLLDIDEIVLKPGESHGKSKPRAAGSEIYAFIETEGPAVINVGNAVPDTITAGSTGVTVLTVVGG